MFSMATELSPSNGCWTAACLQSCYLATGLHVTILLFEEGNRLNEHSRTQGANVIGSECFGVELPGYAMYGVSRATAGDP